LGDVLLVEAAIVFSAALLGGDRGGYAASMALLGPAGGTGMHGKDFVIFESLMAYNIIIDTAFEGKFSDESVFWQNVVFMNAWLVYSWLDTANEDAVNHKDSIQMGVMPIENGLQFSMVYQF
ncbi:MAG: hypothetical protein Q9M44_03085, partial [Ghiorsea sp.]|nr:hypothetical protein [Ghiorsea sp.]